MLHASRRSLERLAVFGHEVYFIHMSENGQRAQPGGTSCTMKMSQTSPPCFYKTLTSPVGELTLVANDHALKAVLWENDDPKRVPLGQLQQKDNHPVLLKTERQLREYFAGHRVTFDLPMEFTGTDFQRSVWQALLSIPFGETRSYAQIARQVGNPSAVRAVGAANGRNPISIIAPCHRVIGSNGKLTGFAGGMEAKAFLLKMEKMELALNPS